MTSQNIKSFISLISVSLIKILPLSISLNLGIRSISVDLPLPDGPIKKFIFSELKSTLRFFKVNASSTLY